MSRGIKQITSEAIVIFKDNIDTDILIPKNYLKTTKRTGFEKALFAPWRYDSQGKPIADFPLNMPENQGKKILIAGENFGCGSSREHAAWALQDFGIDIVIAGSYSPIFYMNYINNLKLPVVLGRTEREALIEADLPITVDLEAKTVSAGNLEYTFEIERDYRNKLIKGLDNIEEILIYEDLIEAYEAEYAK
ncbi:MAG: 3-isopropylmalate dehydratase small subunit [Clostridiaceae bacterium]|mgnify:CR=1 FL=1|nr:3-isopropylmalate dehydratase small subunit [Clostridiaceae bacterium]